MSPHDPNHGDDHDHDRGHDHGHDHGDAHAHPHAEIGQSERPGYYDMMETAVRELLIEKGLFGAGEIRRQIEVLDSRNPALGAKVVAHAWADPAFRARLLANGRAGCEELGISFYDDTQLIVLENTETVHNLIVCTLCSCYPRPVLGLPPDWYKLKPYRARAVAEPRAVLAEFGTHIPDDVEVRVSDSTAMVRYLVLPLRPQGTEDYTEEQLAALVTRDAMIGVVPVMLGASGAVR
ncbi:MAG TPA: nitrile hydratase subunit alpha [Dongiaceae bacterium]